MPKFSTVTIPAELLTGQKGETKTSPQQSPGRKIRWQGFALNPQALKKVAERLPAVAAILIAFLLSRLSVMGESAPFGVAFAAVMMQGSFKRWSPAAGAVGGLLSTGHYPEGAAYAVILLIYYRFADSLSRLHNRMWATSIFIGTAVAFSGAVMALWQEEGLYRLLRSLLDGALATVITQIFTYCAPLFRGAKEQKISGEVCLAALTAAALAVAGLGDLSLWGYNVRGIIGSLLVMTLAFAGGPGVGAVAGAAVGIASGIHDGAAGISIPYYAVCGIIGGMLRKWGQYAVAGGFIAGSAMMIMYLGEYDRLLQTVVETLAAAAIAVMIPPSRLAWLRQLYPDPAAMRGRFAGAAVNPATEKLNHLADMFHDMAATFGSIAENAVLKSQDDESKQLLCAIGNQVCDSCRRRNECWEKEFYQTYQTMLDGLAIAEATKLSKANMTGMLRDSCLHKDQVIEIINLVAEKSRAQEHWQKKTTQLRQMVAEQLAATSSILSNLSAEIRKEYPASSDVPAALIHQCRVLGFPISEVYSSAGTGQAVLEITREPCGGTRECVHTLLPLASDVVGEKMVLRACCGSQGEKLCNLVLQAADRFHVETGKASAAKDDGISGDTCSVSQLTKGKTAIMISDGMGSGKVAASESAMAVKFLERLLAAEFDVDVAVKTVNSMLMLRTPEETFATVDMAIVDTYTGKTEFLKIGSAPSFIKRVREVRTLQSASLPIGILHQIEIEPIRVDLVAGDIIVMVSDGVADAQTRPGEKENWIANYLRRMQSTDPQLIANKVLAEAQSVAPPDRRDDMTVIVARLAEKHTPS